LEEQWHPKVEEVGTAGGVARQRGDRHVASIVSGGRGLRGRRSSGRKKPLVRKKLSGSGVRHGRVA
jgi:hypothetical protein